MTAVRLDRPRALHLPSPSRRAVGWVSAVLALLVVVALVGVADLPTGERSAEAVVPHGARLAARAPLDDVHVFLTVDRGDLVTIVAYEGEKGWLGVDLEPVPGRTPVAWAATEGGGDIPALSVVYGRVDGESVRVEWADATVSKVEAERDGAYVVARRGKIVVEKVVVLDATGRAVLEVTEL